MKYLIIGNGVAGTTAADHLRQNDADGEITMVSAEDLPFYYRVRLPDFLGGGVTETELIAKKPDWYDGNRIALKLGTRIAGIDPARKTAVSETGETFEFDRLLLANGSHPFVPPVKGSDIRGVFTLHNIKDVRAIGRFAEKINDVVLIGGGLLGLETANALHKRGKNVTVVEFFPRLLPRQLDVDGAVRLQSFFEGMDFTFRLGAVTSEILGADRVDRVLLKSGEKLTAEMVIISAGVRPNLELAAMLGLETDKGIIVNEKLQTSNPDIYAAGDVVEFNGRTYGIWPAAMEQGKVAGINIGGGKASYEGTTMSNILRVAGIDLASAGEIDENNRYRAKTVTSETVYKKVVINDSGRVIGCIMLGDRKNFNRISRAITSGEDILAELDSLLEG